MNAESGRMTEIYRRLRWHRIEREQEEVRIARSQRRKKRLDRLLDLREGAIPDLRNSLVWLTRKIWWFLGLYDGGLAAIFGCILLSLWIMTL